MKAMILAAGLGKRMLPLTASTPKPLVKLGNKLLIEYAFQNLKAAGINEIIINIHHLSDQIKLALKDGTQWDLKIHYSVEENLLDTGGGILAAINKNLIGEEPFIVISADIITKFNLATLKNKLNKLAHLILVPNPDYNLQGDFSLAGNILKLPEVNSTNYSNNYTYANIGIFDPKFFHGKYPTIFPLVKLFKQHIDTQQITGEVYSGPWQNIGTINDLATFEQDHL